jgi:O-antigen/teichoic acid export membrane protein
LTGPTKAESVPVFVILCLMFVAGGLVDLCTSGLQLYKRSMTILALSSLSAIINIILNAFLIPRFGLMGAVYATLGSAAAFGIGSWVACPRDLLALPCVRAMLLSLGRGALVWWIAWATNLLGFTSHAARLAAMVMLELVMFAWPALLLDRNLRNALLKQWKHWSGRPA